MRPESRTTPLPRSRSPSNDFSPPRNLGPRSIDKPVYIKEAQVRTCGHGRSLSQFTQAEYLPGRCSPLGVFGEHPFDVSCEFDRQYRSTTKGLGFGMRLGEEVIEVVGIRSIAVVLTRSDHFSHQIEPSAIKMASVGNRSIFECLAFFLRIDA